MIYIPIYFFRSTYLINFIRKRAIKYPAKTSMMHDTRKTPTARIRLYYLYLIIGRNKVIYGVKAKYGVRYFGPAVQSSNLTIIFPDIFFKLIIFFKSKLAVKIITHIRCLQYAEIITKRL